MRVGIYRQLENSAKGAADSDTEARRVGRMEVAAALPPPDDGEKAVSGRLSEVDPVAMSPSLGNQETTPGPLLGSGSAKLKQVRLLFSPTPEPPPPMTIAIATDKSLFTTTSICPSPDCSVDGISRHQENPLSFSTKEMVTTETAEKIGEHVTPISDENVEPGGDKSIIPKPRMKLTKAQRDALRTEREVLRAEREALRTEKERARVEARAKKEAEKTKKEQERKEKREQREQEEREKKERREKREAERKKKEEEKKKKDEDKKHVETVMEQAKQEQQRKEQIAKDRFMGFFSKLPNASTKKESPTRPDFNIITPFPVQPHMAIAQSPSRPRDMTRLDDALVRQDNRSTTYLAECTMKKNKCSNAGKVASVIVSDGEDDVMIVSPPTQSVKRSKFKLLQFHQNHRPAYWGTWRKRSPLVSPRNPYKKDEGLLDYDVDSDDEWEEEEPGESLSNSEGEGQCEGGSGEESDGEEDGFFVPHGYLSDDEGEQSDGEMGNETGPDSGDYRKQKQLAKAKAWEADYARKCQPLKVVKIGCIWCQKSDRDGLSRQEGLLQKFAAMVLVDVPILVKITTEQRPQPDHHGANSESNRSQTVPNEALPDLISLVHGSSIGLGRLIRIFRVHWGAKIKDKKDTPSEHTPETPKTPHNDDAEYEKASGISKRQLELKILAIATKEQRAPNPKQIWYVHESVLQQNHLDANNLAPFVPLVTPFSERKAQLSCEKPRQVSPETPCTSKKGLKRKGERIPSVKALFEVLAKSPGAISSNVGPPQYKKPRLDDASGKNVADPSTPVTTLPCDSHLSEPPMKRACHERDKPPESVIVIHSDDSQESNNTKENVTAPTVITGVNSPSTDCKNLPMVCATEEPRVAIRALQECTNSQQNPPALEHNVPEGIDWRKITMESNVNTIVVSADVHS